MPCRFHPVSRFFSTLDAFEPLWMVGERDLDVWLADYQGDPHHEDGCHFLDKWMLPSPVEDWVLPSAPKAYGPPPAAPPREPPRETCCALLGAWDDLADLPAGSWWTDHMGSGGFDYDLWAPGDGYYADL